MPSRKHEELTEDAQGEQSTPAAAPESIDLAELLPALIQRCGRSRPLEKIINDVVRGEELFDARRALKRQLQRRIAAQDGNSGAELICRAILRQLEFHYDNEIVGLEIEHKAGVVNELCVNVARCLMVAAEGITRYGKALEDIEHAKAARDPRQIAAARSARLQLSDHIRKSMLNVARAAVGDDVDLQEQG